MGRIYSVEFTNQALTAANGDHDYFEIDPAAEKPVRPIAIFIGQESQEGDALEDFVRWAILRCTGGTFTSGSGGAAPTPRPLDIGDPAAGFAAETANTTVATTSGTLQRIHSDAFNIRTGLQLILPPELRVIVSGAANDALLIRQESTLDATTTMSGTLYVEEGPF